MHAAAPPVRGSIVSTWRRRLREVFDRHVAADLAVLAGGVLVGAPGLLAGWINFTVRLDEAHRMPDVQAAALLAAVAFVALRRRVRDAGRPLAHTRRHVAADLRTLVALFALAAAIAYVTKTGDAFSRGWVLSWLAAAALALFLLRLFVAKWVVPRAAGLLAHRIAVVGPAEGVEALRRSLPQNVIVSTPVHLTQACSVERGSTDSLAWFDQW